MQQRSGEVRIHLGRCCSNRELQQGVRGRVPAVMSHVLRLYSRRVGLHRSPALLQSRSPRGGPAAAPTLPHLVSPHHIPQHSTAQHSTTLAFSKQRRNSSHIPVPPTPSLSDKAFPTLQTMQMLKNHQLGGWEQ